MRSRWGLACLVAAAGALSRSPGPLQPEYRAVFEPEQPVQGQTVRLSLAGVPAWLPVECRYEGKPVPIESLPDGTRRALIPEAGDAAGRDAVLLSVPGPRG